LADDLFHQDVVHIDQRLGNGGFLDFFGRPCSIGKRGHHAVYAGTLHGLGRPCGGYVRALSF
jgi:hypothetical protein